MAGQHTDASALGGALAETRAWLVSIVGAALISVTASVPVAAQCTSDLRKELGAIAAIADSMLRKPFADKGANSVKRPDAEAVIRDASLFGAKASLAGPAASCFVSRQPQFQQAALNALPSDTSKALTRDELRQAIAEGMTAVLAERYQPTDRISLVLGIAITVGIDQRALEEWKVVNHIDTVVVNGTKQVQERRFIANDSRSRSFPSATTGVLVRVHDPTDGFWPRLVPNGVFGAVQISGAGGTGPVNGASLGVSWKLIPAAQLLIGYSTTRHRTLRHDLREGYKKNTLIPLPPGETQESILGTSSTNGIIFSLALPVSLASSLGLK
jgi:hypothetical protein